MAANKYAFVYKWLDIGICKQNLASLVKLLVNSRQYFLLLPSYLIINMPCYFFFSYPTNKVYISTYLSAVLMKISFFNQFETNSLKIYITLSIVE